MTPFASEQYKKRYAVALRNWSAGYECCVCGQNAQDSDFYVIISKDCNWSIGNPNQCTAHPIGSNCAYRLKKIGKAAIFHKGNPWTRMADNLGAKAFQQILDRTHGVCAAAAAKGEKL